MNQPNVKNQSESCEIGGENAVGSTTTKTKKKLYPVVAVRENCSDSDDCDDDDDGQSDDCEVAGTSEHRQINKTVKKLNSFERENQPDKSDSNQEDNFNTNKNIGDGDDGNEARWWKPGKKNGCVLDIYFIACEYNRFCPKHADHELNVEDVVRILITYLGKIDIKCWPGLFQMKIPVPKKEMFNQLLWGADIKACKANPKFQEWRKKHPLLCRKNVSMARSYTDQSFIKYFHAKKYNAVTFAMCKKLAEAKGLPLPQIDGYDEKKYQSLVSSPFPESRAIWKSRICLPGYLCELFPFALNDTKNGPDACEEPVVNLPENEESDIDEIVGNLETAAPDDDEVAEHTPEETIRKIEKTIELLKAKSRRLEIQKATVESNLKYKRELGKKLKKVEKEKKAETVLLEALVDLVGGNLGEKELEGIMFVVEIIKDMVNGENVSPEYLHRTVLRVFGTKNLNCEPVVGAASRSQSPRDGSLDKLPSLAKPVNSSVLLLSTKEPSPDESPFFPVQSAIPNKSPLAENSSLSNKSPSIDKSRSRTSSVSSSLSSSSSSEDSSGDTSDESSDQSSDESSDQSSDESSDDSSSGSSSDSTSSSSADSDSSQSTTSNNSLVSSSSSSTSSSSSSSESSSSKNSSEDDDKEENIKSNSNQIVSGSLASKPQSFPIPTGCPNSELNETLRDVVKRKKIVTVNSTEHHDQFSPEDFGGQKRMRLENDDMVLKIQPEKNEVKGNNTNNENECVQDVQPTEEEEQLSTNKNLQEQEQGEIQVDERSITETDENAEKEEQQQQQESVQQHLEEEMQVDECRSKETNKEENKDHSSKQQHLDDMQVDRREKEKPVKLKEKEEEEEETCIEEKQRHHQQENQLEEMEVDEGGLEEQGENKDRVQNCQQQQLKELLQGDECSTKRSSNEEETNEERLDDSQHQENQPQHLEEMEMDESGKEGPIEKEQDNLQQQQSKELLGEKFNKKRNFNEEETNEEKEEQQKSQHPECEENRLNGSCKDETVQNENQEEEEDEDEKRESQQQQLDKMQVEVVEESTNEQQQQEVKEVKLQEMEAEMVVVGQQKGHQHRNVDDGNDCDMGHDSDDNALLLECMIGVEEILAKQKQAESNKARTETPSPSGTQPTQEKNTSPSSDWSSDLRTPPRTPSKQKAVTTPKTDTSLSKPVTLKKPATSPTTSSPNNTTTTTLAKLQSVSSPTTADTPSKANTPAKTPAKPSNSPTTGLYSKPSTPAKTQSQQQQQHEKASPLSFSGSSSNESTPVKPKVLSGNGLEKKSDKSEVGSTSPSESNEERDTMPNLEENGNNESTERKDKKRHKKHKKSQRKKKSKKGKREKPSDNNCDSSN